jgi:hypothetical protein
MPISELDVARAQFALGNLMSADLPVLATNLLAGGVDTPSIRALAGVSQPTMSECAPLFERVMQESGLPPFEKHQAVRVLVRHYAEAIVTGEIEPYQGASEIWSLSDQYEPFQEVSIFVGLASQIDDDRQMALSNPDPYADYVDTGLKDIRNAARQYLAAHTI